MTQPTTQPQCEISWFSALCDDDYEFLGVPDPYLASSWEHCRNIVMRAEEGGFDNVLLPSGYALGLDTTVFAAAVATQVQRIRLLMAVRIGEDWPPQLARRIATLDRILGATPGGVASPDYQHHLLGHSGGNYGGWPALCPHG